MKESVGKREGKRREQAYYTTYAHFMLHCTYSIQGAAKNDTLKVSSEQQKLGTALYCSLKWVKKSCPTDINPGIQINSPKCHLTHFIAPTLYMCSWGATRLWVRRSRAKAGKPPFFEVALFFCMYRVPMPSPGRPLIHRFRYENWHSVMPKCHGMQYILCSLGAMRPTETWSDEKNGQDIPPKRYDSSTTKGGKKKLFNCGV